MIYKERIDAAAKEMEEVFKKHQVSLLPLMKYTEQGLYPSLGWVDNAPKSEIITPDKMSEL